MSNCAPLNILNLLAAAFAVTVRVDVYNSQRNSEFNTVTLRGLIIARSKSKVQVYSQNFKSPENPELIF